MLLEITETRTDSLTSVKRSYICSMSMLTDICFKDEGEFAKPRNIDKKCDSDSDQDNFVILLVFIVIRKPSPSLGKDRFPLELTNTTI